jgi:hypothetical protein
MLFMILTDDDAAKVFNTVVTILQEQKTRELLDGIDESRRLGIEEGLPEQKGLELKQVARTRRRPPNNLEMVHIILALLYQRLIVLPQIGVTLKKRLNAEEIFWRVDTEFVSVERLPEAKLSDLLPVGFEDVMSALARVIELSQLSNTEHGV